MATPEVVIEEVAKHFMVPRVAWCGARSKAKNNVIIRAVACAVAERLSVNRAAFAEVIHLAEQTIADIGRKAAYQYSGHVSDVLARIQKRSAT